MKLNTDKIPAMLTAHEGVLNKYAMRLPGVKKMVKQKNKAGNQIANSMDEGQGNPNAAVPAAGLPATSLPAIPSMGLNSFSSLTPQKPPMWQLPHYARGTSDVVPIKRPPIRPPRRPDDDDDDDSPVRNYQLGTSDVTPMPPSAGGGINTPWKLDAPPMSGEVNPMEQFSPNATGAGAGSAVYNSGKATSDVTPPPVINPSIGSDTNSGMASPLNSFAAPRQPDSASLYNTIGKQLPPPIPMPVTPPSPTQVTAPPFLAPPVNSGGLPAQNMGFNWGNWSQAAPWVRAVMARFGGMGNLKPQDAG